MINQIHIITILLLYTKTSELIKHKSMILQKSKEKIGEILTNEYCFPLALAFAVLVSEFTIIEHTGLQITVINMMLPPKAKLRDTFT